MIAWFLRKWRRWRDPYGERQILDKYSTPGLKRSELSRYQMVQQARARGYEGDACVTCGNFTMIRNGTCLRCDSCGSTTGCS
jgi:hypothetical protein